MRSSLHADAADSRVQVPCVLPDNEKINVVRPFALYGRFDARVQFHWSEVDVLIQGKTGLEQDPFFQDPRRHVGMSDGSKKDRIELAQFLDSAIRQQLPGSLVSLAPEVKLSQFNFEVELRSRRLENLDCFGSHLWPSPVSGNYRNLMHLPNLHK